MQRGLLCALIIGAVISRAAAQSANPGDSNPFRKLLRPYRAEEVPPVSFSESNRINNLLRGGNLYLSLSDAIALAIENNLDVEIQRYGPLMAGTDLRRTKGGGTTRGVPLVFSETPPGLGGPGSPLLTTAATGSAPVAAVPTDITQLTSVTGAQTSLAISTLPFSLGPPIPQFDPSIVANVSWGRQETPLSNVVVAGTNSLLQRNTIANFSLIQAFIPGS